MIELEPINTQFPNYVKFHTHLLKNYIITKCNIKQASLKTKTGSPLLQTE